MSRNVLFHIKLSHCAGGFHAFKQIFVSWIAKFGKWIATIRYPLIPLIRTLIANENYAYVLNECTTRNISTEWHETYLFVKLLKRNKFA